ncbi:MAG: nucleotidyltransferase domain-containing protein [Nanoarchaeota archaeon]
MERIIKQTREVGTSAGVLLPRNWLNKQVVVTLFSSSIKDISKDVLSILISKNLNEEVKGIYLFGSYARGDYDFDSDIDILVITHGVNKLIKEGIYEISLVSEDNFSRNLTKSLIYLSMIKEAKVILNKELIQKYRNSIKKLNFSTLFNEIGRMIKLNKEIVKFHQEEGLNILDGTVYSIVLRLRELYLIKCIKSNKEYIKKDFIKIVGEKSYSAYLRIKREDKELDDISPNDTKILIDLSEKWLKEIKG